VGSCLIITEKRVGAEDKKEKQNKKGGIEQSIKVGASLSNAIQK
jgi:hypothetical protein